MCTISYDMKAIIRVFKDYDIAVPGVREQFMLTCLPEASIQSGCG